MHARLPGRFLARILFVGAGDRDRTHVKLGKGFKRSPTDDHYTVESMV